MTLSPSPLAQSTLSEKCAIYLDHVTDTIPAFLHSLRPLLDPCLTCLSATPFRSLAQALPFHADGQRTALCVAVLLCVLTVTAMSWRSPFPSLWGRSPKYTSAPQVNDADFSYITPDDIVEPPSHGSRPGDRYDGDEGPTEPDVICLKHRGTIYPLHFRAYAIGDGALTVGMLRQEAAAKLDARNPNRIRLLYKGRLLKDDSRSCKAEGLKQHSEVLCVVSEVGSSTPSDLSDYDSGRTSDLPQADDGVDSAPRVDGGREEEEEEVEEPAPPHHAGHNGGKTGSKKGKKNKKKGGKKPPPPREGGTGTASPSPAPSLKDFRTPLEQANALSAYLQQQLIPLCDEYVADPPTEPKKREFEYKKLSETILTQVMMRADGIETEGNEGARNARRALIKEAQATLNRLDQIGKQ